MYLGTKDIIIIVKVINGTKWAINFHDYLKNKLYSIVINIIILSVFYNL